MNAEIFGVSKVKEGNGFRGFEYIRRLMFVPGTEGENETCSENVGRAPQGTEIENILPVLDTNREEPALDIYDRFPVEFSRNAYHLPAWNPANSTAASPMRLKIISVIDLTPIEVLKGYTEACAAPNNARRTCVPLSVLRERVV